MVSASASPQVDGVTYSEPTAIISGKIEGKEAVPVRVHDACFTSEVRVQCLPCKQGHQHPLLSARQAHAVLGVFARRCLAP